MNFTEQRYRHVRNVTWVIIVIHAIFFIATPLFPFIDLPNHLAEATIYKYYGGIGNTLSSYYEPVPWYFPNTFHTVFCSFFPDVELGNRIFLIVYVTALQLSMFLVIRQLKGHPWYGLLGTVFTFNYNLTFGFVGFVISIPAVILLFYIILRDIKKDSLKLKLVMAFLFVLIFLMHAQTALFALVFYGMTMLVAYRKSWYKLAIRVLLVPLPMIILISAWWFTKESTSEGSTLEFLLQYYRNCFLPEFLGRLRLVILDNYQLGVELPGVTIALVLFLSILLPVLYFKPWKNEYWKDSIVNAVYPLMFFGSALICYFLLPTGLPGQSPLSQRFCTFVVLSLIIVLSVLMSNSEARQLRSYVIVVCLIYMGLWFEYIITFNVENKSFRPAFFEGTDNDKKLAGLIYQNKYRRSKVYIHFPNYFIVWKRGIATTKIIDYRFGVVKRVASESIVPFYDEYVGDHYQHVTTYHAQDYLLVRGTPPIVDDPNIRNSSILRESGVWKLYKNNNIRTSMQED
jgi:hypothetical protein